MSDKKIEHAKRVVITIVTDIEWHEDDFDGDLEQLKSLHLSDEVLFQDFREEILNDLLERGTVTTEWRDITYVRES